MLEARLGVAKGSVLTPIFQHFHLMTFTFQLTRRLFPHLLINFPNFFEIFEQNLLFYNISAKSQHTFLGSPKVGISLKCQPRYLLGMLVLFILEKKLGDV